ncbi:MAG: TRAP transporter small permease [Tissierellaceae bacterium]|nr:TRAP transporter small permease [Tissierellaceae bacterium]
MKKGMKVLDKFEEIVLILLMVAMTISVVTQVFSRTVLNVSPSWTEEVARYMLVWITFIGASLGVKRGAHMGVEAFTMILPKKVQKIVQAVTLLICAGFTAVTCVNSISILQLQMATGQVSAAIQLPMWIPYSGVTIGMLLMTIRFLETFVNTVKNPEEVGGGN